LATTSVVGLTSDANGITGLSNSTLTSGSIAITGAAYNFASPTLNTTGPVAFGLFHEGSATGNTQIVSISNTTISNPSFQDSLDVSPTSNNTSVTGNTTNITAGNSGTITLTANTSTAGSLASTVTLGYVSNANGVAGLSNSSLTSGSIATTGEVYSGQSTWNTAAAGAWGALTGPDAFGTNWAGNGGSPGLDPNFTNTDVANFGALAASTIAVSLNSAAPSLLGIAFTGTTTSYSIGQGTGANSITLSGLGAYITDAGSSDTIAAPLILDSNVTATLSSGAVLTISGSITDSGGALTASGAGTLILSGTSVSTAPITVSGGNLEVSNLASLGTGSSLTLSNGGTFTYTGGTGTLAKNITVATGSTGTFDNTGGGVVTISGAVSKNGSVLDLSGGQFVVSGVISGSTSDSDLDVSGGSTIGLTNANTYNGPTVISGGSTLLTGINNALPSPAPYTDMTVTSSTDTLDILGTSQTVDSISGSGQIISSNGSASTPAIGSGASAATGSITVDTTNYTGGTDTFAGSLGGTGSATNLSLTKAGTGVLSLTGLNTYTGGTTVSGGTLLANSSNSTGSGLVTVASGGVLGGGGTIAPSGVASGTAVNILSGGLLDPSAGTSTPTHMTLNLNAGTSLTLNAGANLAFILGDPTNSATSDEVIVNGGTVNVGAGTLTINNINFTPQAGFGVGTYSLITTSAMNDMTGSLTSNAFALDEQLSPGIFGQLVINNNQTLEVVVSTTAPEPSTWALMIGGLVVLVAFQIRRRRS
jgi:autotransporter-associated beta strand protein